MSVRTGIRRRSYVDHPSMMMNAWKCTFSRKILRQYAIVEVVNSHALISILFFETVSFLHSWIDGGAAVILLPVFPSAFSQQPPFDLIQKRKRKKLVNYADSIGGALSNLREKRNGGCNRRNFSICSIRELYLYVNRVTFILALQRERKKIERFKFVVGKNRFCVVASE